MRIIASVLAALATIASTALEAQDLLKYNYKRNGYVYTGAERIYVSQASSPVEIKLGRIVFPDGVALYTLRLDFESSSPWKMPKNASITFDLSNGSAVLSRNSSDAPNLVAPRGIEKGGETVYLNYGEYYFEESDMKKLLSGVESIDAARRMSTSGHVKVNFKNNSFSKALQKAYGAISEAAIPTREIGSHLSGIDDTAGGNRLASTESLDAGTGISIKLNYLYSAENNSENYDIVLGIPGKTLAGGAAVAFFTARGEQIILKQEQDLPEGSIICYPTKEEIKRLGRGVSRIVLDTIAGQVSINTESASFADALDILYNSLQTAAIL